MSSLISKLVCLAMIFGLGEGLDIAQYQRFGYQAGEIILNNPTVYLPVQTTYADGQYLLAVFLSNDGMVSV